MLLRKLIHLSSIILLLVLKYFHLHFDSKIYGATILVTLSILSITIEVLRKHTDFREIFLKIFGPLLKNGEVKGKLTGATYLILSMTITYLLFDFKYFYYSSLIAILVDGTTPLITWLIFRKDFKDHSHLITFLISAVLIAFIVNSGIPLPVKLTASIIISLVEYLNPPPDDNFYAVFVGAFIIFLLNSTLH